MFSARLSADEALAGKNVVAHRHVIVGILALGVCEQLRSPAQSLEARELRIGLPGRELDEEAFRDVVRESRAGDGVDAEVLDADLAREDADLEVLGVDLRRLDLAPLDVGLDDGRLTARRPRAPSDRGRNP